MIVEGVPAETSYFLQLLSNSGVILGRGQEAVKLRKDYTNDIYGE